MRWNKSQSFLAVQSCDHYIFESFSDDRDLARNSISLFTERFDFDANLLVVVINSFYINLLRSYIFIQSKTPESKWAVCEIIAVIQRKNWSRLFASIVGFAALILPTLPPFFFRCCGRDELLWAQILAVIALLISVAGWWLAWAAGLVAVIILILDCCCNMPSGLFTVAGVCAMIAAIGEFLVAAKVVDFTTQDRIDISVDNMMIMAIIAGLLWVFASVVALQYGRDLC